MIHHFLVLHLEFIGMMIVYVVEYVNKNLMNVQRVLWIDMVFHIVNMIIQSKFFLSDFLTGFSAKSERWVIRYLVWTRQDAARMSRHPGRKDKEQGVSRKWSGRPTPDPVNREIDIVAGWIVWIGDDLSEMILNHMCRGRVYVWFLEGWQ